MIADGTTAKQWDAATGRLLGLPMVHPRGFQGRNAISQVAFSPDGRTILTAGLYEARLWNAVTAKSLGPAMEISGRDSPPFTQLSIAAISPDGRTLLADDGDTARLWDVTFVPDEDDTWD